jgi:hypothetical protein
MKSLWIAKIRFALMLLLLVGPNVVYATIPAPLADQAVTFVHLLVKHDYQAAYKHFDSQVKHALPPDQLAVAWNQITGKLGTFKTTGQTKVAPARGYTAVFVKSIFDHGAIWVQVAYDKSGKIAGIHFLPTS